MENQTLYDALTAAGVPIDNHESDLYFRATPEALTILAKYPEFHKSARRFMSQIDGETWIDVPFAYTPFWTSQQKEPA